jgi:hypothetical protein
MAERYYLIYRNKKHTQSTYQRDTRKEIISGGNNRVRQRFHLKELKVPTPITISFRHSYSEHTERREICDVVCIQMAAHMMCCHLYYTT